MTSTRATDEGEPPVSGALRAALGMPRVIRRLSSSSRSRVWLVEFAGAPAIVKQVVDGPDAGDRYTRETTALRLAGRVRPRVVPDLLGTDPDARVLVLEHLTEQGRPGDWPVDYATALARLHATTGAAGAGLLPAWTGPAHTDVRAFLGVADRLGVAVPPRVTDELDALLARSAAVPRQALLHGDPCPDNAIHTGDGIRFVDLEGAALGDGQAELAYLRIGFPTCWCVKAVPGAVRDEAERAYRATWQNLTGTDAGDRIADACAGWLVRGHALVHRAVRGTEEHLDRLPQDDWHWGTATARQRLLHRLGVVADTAAGHPGLSGFAGLCAAMRDRLRGEWPATGPVPVSGGNPLH